MNEAEIIVAWGEVSAHLWTILQFWASISFGIIALAHFAPERLNNFLVAFVIFLYTVFSFMCGGLYLSDFELLAALYEEADILLSERGEGAIFLSKFAQYQNMSGVPILLFGFPSIYLGCIAYLIYRYRGERQNV